MKASDPKNGELSAGDGERLRAGGRHGGHASVLLFGAAVAVIGAIA